MFHMLIPWGVMTSHRISIGSKLIESNDFTQKEYDDLKLLGVGKYSFGHRCN